VDGPPLASAFLKFCVAGRCGRVFDLLMRYTGPLAIMPSAKTGPDRKLALEAHRRKWVLLSSGIDRLLQHFMSALSKPFERCFLAAL